MCLYSLSIGQKIEKARVGEVLTRGDYQHHAVLLDENGSIRCVRSGSEMQVENLQFIRKGDIFGPTDWIGQPYNGRVPRKQLLAWHNKTFKVTLVKWSDGPYAADAIKLPDGSLVQLSWIERGVQMTKHRKVRKDKGVRKVIAGMKVLNKAIVEAEKTPPLREEVEAD
jgi:hypothetical protein